MWPEAGASKLGSLGSVSFFSTSSCRFWCAVLALRRRSALDSLTLKGYPRTSGDARRVSAFVEDSHGAMPYTAAISHAAVTALSLPGRRLGFAAAAHHRADHREAVALVGALPLLVDLGIEDDLVVEGDG